MTIQPTTERFNPRVQKGAVEYKIVPSVGEGRPIPILFGTRDLENPLVAYYKLTKNNIITLTGLTNDPIERQIRDPDGSGRIITNPYRTDHDEFRLVSILVWCAGSIDDIYWITVDDLTVWVGASLFRQLRQPTNKNFLYDYSEHFWGLDEPLQAIFYLFNGEANRSQRSFFTRISGVLGNELSSRDRFRVTPAFRGATTSFIRAIVGKSSTPRRWKMRAVRLPSKGWHDRYQVPKSVTTEVPSRILTRNVERIVPAYINQNFNLFVYVSQWDEPGALLGLRTYIKQMILSLDPLTQEAYKNHGIKFNVRVCYDPYTSDPQSGNVQSWNWSTQNQRHRYVDYTGQAAADGDWNDAINNIGQTNRGNTKSDWIDNDGSAYNQHSNFGAEFIAARDFFNNTRVASNLGRDIMFVLGEGDTTEFGSNLRRVLLTTLSTTILRGQH